MLKEFDGLGFRVVQASKTASTSHKSDQSKTLDCTLIVETTHLADLLFRGVSQVCKHHTLREHV